MLISQVMPPLSRNTSRMARPNRRRLHPWLLRFNQCLWHIHRSSSILFLSLVLLNGLAGVLSSLERNKLADELKKKLASNSTTSSEEEELAHEILALFDYDENDSFAMNNNSETKTLMATNSTEEREKKGMAGNGTSENGRDKIEMQFNVDSANNGLLESVLNWTKQSEGIGTNNGTSWDTPVHENATKEGNPPILLSSISNATTTTISALMENIILDQENGTSYGTSEAAATNSANTSSPPSGVGEEGKGNSEIGWEKTTNSLEMGVEIGGDKTQTAPAADDSTTEASTTTETSSLSLSWTELSEKTSSEKAMENSSSTSTTLAEGNGSTEGIGEIPTGENNTETSTSTNSRSTISAISSTKLAESTTAKEEDGENVERQRKEEIEEGGIGGNNNLVEDEFGHDERKEEPMKETDNNIKAAILELQKQLEQRSEHSKQQLSEADVAGLYEYRVHLRSILDNVESLLISKGASIPAQMSDFPKSKRFIAISSSLPNWESALFLNRKNALSAASVDAAQIRKSPPHASSTERPSAADNPTEVSPTTSTSSEANMSPSSTQPSSIAKIMPRINVMESGANKVEQQQSPGEVDNNADSGSDSSEHSNPRKTGFFRAESIAFKSLPFNPVRNNSVAECMHLSQAELVNELKQKGTYNPELMAWDASGVFRFLDRSIVDQYERQSKPPKSSEQAVRRNVEALEQLLGELNLECEVRTPEVISRLSNLTFSEPRRSIISPTLRSQDEVRQKRNVQLADKLVHSFNSSRSRDYSSSTSTSSQQQGGRHKGGKKQKLIGDVHVVPFGCDKRGYSEDGYLRLCGACQAIRKLPDEFFPPFINEVMCDEDKACLYFYDYPHGKCKQKHMNFVVLRNVGTELCQVWEKFNLNVRVSCECFVDEMSFFAKYV